MTTKQCILGDQSILATKWKGGLFTMFIEEQIFFNSSVINYSPLLFSVEFK